MGAKFCVECGNSLYEKKNNETAETHEVDSDSLTENIFSPPPPPEPEPQAKGTSFENAAEIWQLKQQFFDKLKKQVEEEHYPAKYSKYIDRLDSSGFHETLDINIRSIYQTIEQKRNMADPDFKLDSYRHGAFENLLDSFIIRFCQDINPIPLPEEILKYQKHSDANDLYDLIMDYLDLDAESEPIFTDFIKMPVQKLQNASKSFLQTSTDEKIFFICDQSIAGSCKEGFAMTDRALYWRAQLLKPQRIGFRQIISVAREQEWILVNEHFFNVNPSVNLKMMKLLKKLQRTV